MSDWLELIFDWVGTLELLYLTSKLTFSVARTGMRPHTLTSSFVATTLVTTFWTISFFSAKSKSSTNFITPPANSSRGREGLLAISSSIVLISSTILCELSLISCLRSLYICSVISPSPKRLRKRWCFSSSPRNRSLRRANSDWRGDTRSSCHFLACSKTSSGCLSRLSKLLHTKSSSTGTFIPCR